MDNLTPPPIRTALINNPDGSPFQQANGNQGPGQLSTEKSWYYYWRDAGRQINQQGAILAELVTHGTHANRPDPSTMPDSALYVEDDRGALYENRSGTWYFVAGTMWGTISPDQRPADLGAHDQSFHFQATTTPPREFIWSGTAWIETTGLLDPTTTAGDLLVRGSSIVQRLGKGTNGQVLTANAGAPLGVDWEVPPGSPGSTSGVISAFGRTGVVVGATGDYTAAQVTNAVANTRQVLAGAGMTGGGTLAADVTLAAKPMAASGLSHSAGIVPDPGSTAGTTRYLREDATWVAPSAVGAVTSVFTRTGAVVAATADYTAAQVTNAVDSTQTYANPAWITALAYAKITGVPAFLTALSPWTTNINGAGFTLTNVSTVGIGTAAPRSGSLLSVVPATAPTTPAGATTVTICESSNSAGYQLQLGMFYDTAWRCGIQSLVNNVGGSLVLNGAGGFVGIGLSPSYQLQLSTDSAGKPGTSTWAVVSDSRLKQNVEPVKDDSLAILGKLDWVRYEYNGKADTPQGLKAIGLVAQELQSQLPEAIRSSKTRLAETDAEETDVLAIDYHHIIVHSARAIQQLKSEIESLKALLGKPQA